MGTQRSKYAGGDQDYLRDEQYLDGSRLALRANLHDKYRTSPTPFYDWAASHFDLFENATVLEVGCGTGWLWEQSTVPVPSGVELMLTDLSPGMVDGAVASIDATGRFASVTGQTADLQALPFDPSSFDRVVANHMLYHLPDPDRGVAELARVVRPDGVVFATTNGHRHMQQLWQIRGDVFDIAAIDRTIDVFGAVPGFAVMRDHFDDVRWLTYHDELRCTDPADVLAYICSMPPAEDAAPDQLKRLDAEIRRRFEIGGGAMIVTKDVGCFVCRVPTGV